MRSHPKSIYARDLKHGDVVGGKDLTFVILDAQRTVENRVKLTFIRPGSVVKTPMSVVVRPDNYYADLGYVIEEFPL